MNQLCASELAENRNEISALSFQLWEKAGCPEGQDLEFWLAAETRLLAPQPDSAELSKMLAMCC
jgi:DUF2934 family protein